MVDEAQIKADVEAVKLQQQARDDAEKTKEFEDMRRRNEAKIKERADYESQLSNEKSSAGRIRLRQQESERMRQENLRISAMNKGVKPKTPYEQKMINTENLKGTIKSAVSRAPAALDRAVTGTFSPIVAGSTGEIKQKQSFSKGVVQESKQFSKAMASAPKKPVTGGKVKSIQNPFPIQSNQDRFVGMLFGGTQQQQPQQSGKGKPQKQSAPQQQQPGGIDPMAPLNNLMRRIL